MEVKNSAPQPQLLNSASSLDRARRVDEVLEQLAATPAPSPQEAARLQAFMNKALDDIGIARTPPEVMARAEYKALLATDATPRAEKNEPAPENPRQQILSQIERSPRAKANFQNLPKAQQERYLQLAESLFSKRFTSSPAGNGGITLQGPGPDPNLFKLLEDGKLLDRDPEGHTLLDNLIALKGQQFASGLDGDRTFKEVLRQVAFPDTIRQGSKNTCGPTVVEHIHASRNPADYVRVMAGLTSPSGEARLRNGQTVRRGDGLLEDDGSGRSAASRIYQATMMEFGNGSQSYDNRTDHHYRFSLFGTPFWQDHDGAYTTEVERMMDSVLGSDYELTRKSDNAEAEIAEQLRQGRPVVALIRWSSGGNHYLLVESMTDSAVRLRNPWGTESGSDGSNPDNGPRRTGGEGGHVEMSKTEFFSRLLQYSRPDRRRPHPG